MTEPPLIPNAEREADEAVKFPKIQNRTTRFYIARHGQTVSNREGRFCGHSETALTELGQRQAAALGERLQGVRLHAAVTSDLSRAIDTAAAVLRFQLAPDIPSTTDPAFRELHYGEWEMHRERDVAKTALHVEQFARMRAEDPAWQPPGGETIEMVRDRITAALAALVRVHPGESILIVSHGTAINCLLAGVLAMAPSHTFRIAIANCGLSELHYHPEARGGRFTAARINDTTHLAALDPPKK